MAEKSPGKVCVILGAGASYGVRNESSPVINSGLQPPLTKELFDFENRPEFFRIAKNYNGAIVLSTRLAPNAKDPNCDLENTLRSLADHSSPHIQEHFRYIPPYLRDLIMECSYNYTHHPSCYISLAQALLDDLPSEVLFLVLNYDDLLEQALYKATGGKIRFESIDDYIREDYPVKVIKLHGSINWFKAIGSASADWNTSLLASDVLKKPPDNEIHVTVEHGRSDPYATFQLKIDGNIGYPLLTAPLAGKGVSGMVCPERHLGVARDFLRDCYKYVVIGCSGRDLDLLELLQSSIPHKPWAQFVCGDKDESENVRRRFAKVANKFQSINSINGTVGYAGGFESYVAGDELVKFLGAW